MSEHPQPNMNLPSTSSQRASSLSQRASPLSQRASYLSPSGELWLVAVVSTFCLTWMSKSFGVWEPWESMTAQVLDWMWSHETWLQINVPLSKGGARYVPELPFGLWPTLLSYHLSPTELGLRLPSMIISVLCAITLFIVARARFGRAAAWLGVMFFIATPSVSLSTRFMVGGGIGWLWCTLSCLSLLALYEVQGEINKRVFWRVFWRWTAWGTWLFGALSLGVLGALLPLVILGYHCLTSSPPQDKDSRASLSAHLLPASLMFSILMIACWRVWSKAPEGVDLLSLWVWIDPIYETFEASEHTGFQTVIHQLGFGLFPIGALIPVAFAALVFFTQFSSPQLSSPQLSSLQLSSPRLSSPQLSSQRS